MATEKVVIGGSLKVTASQLAELFRQIEKHGLNSFHIQQFLDRQDPFGLHNLNDKRIWALVYELCGVEFSLSKVDWNIKPDEWTIPVEAEITPNRIVEAMRGLGVEFELCLEDLDDHHFFHDRKASTLGPYLVNFRTRVESEEEFGLMSGFDLEQKSICGITLTERLLLEFAFHLFTGKYLDISRMTLCSGSYYSFSNGHRIPIVYSERGKVLVRVMHPFTPLEKASTRKVMGIHVTAKT